MHVCDELVQLGLIFCLCAQVVGAEIDLLAGFVYPADRVPIFGNPYLTEVHRLPEIAEDAAAIDRWPQIDHALETVIPDDLEHALDYGLAANDAWKLLQSIFPGS